MVADTRFLKSVSFKLKVRDRPRDFHGTLYPLALLVSMRQKGVKISLRELPGDVKSYLHENELQCPRSNTIGLLEDYFLEAEKRLKEACSDPFGGWKERPAFLELADALVNAHERFNTRQLVDRYEERALIESCNPLGRLLYPGEPAVEV